MMETLFCDFRRWGKTYSFVRAVALALVGAASTVTAFADALPDGYTQLPYIKANSKAQVKTGYTPAATDRIVMTWCPTQVSTTETLWCARSGTTEAAFTAFAYNGSKFGITINSTAYNEKSPPSGFTQNKRDNLIAYTKYTAIADGNAKTLVVTNAFTGEEVVNVSWTVANNFTVGSQICLFASHSTNINSPNNWASHFLYSFKVYDAAGTLKLDLVPAKDSSGTVGLYDTVGGSFLTKSNGNGSLSDKLIDKTFDDDFTLLDDEVFGTVTVASDKTLNLNGHKLTVGGLAGDGTITAGLQDLTSPDPNGGRVTHTGTFYGGSVGANLFNDNYARAADGAHRIIATAANLPISVTYDFGADSPQKVDLYKIYCGTWEGNRLRGAR